ncbi:MAG: head decoration protein [Pseudobdellovibrionaceae bacterium]|nr:head decoration protein [Pseudobdellovibrionaceae bacterium]
MGYEPGFGEIGEYRPQDLIAGDFPLQSETIVLESGQTLKRGTLLGKKTAGGKYVISAKLTADDKPIADGSEVPYRILAEDVDASSGDKLTIAYHTGSFYQGGITLGKGHTVATVKPVLEPISIYIKG